MGIILDTSSLIDAERRGESVEELLMRLHRMHGETVAAIPAISVVEMTHGIYRAKNESVRQRRRTYAEELYRDLPIHPLTFEIARLAGRIEGQEAAHGNVVEFEDLLIGATALFLGYRVATLNFRHFSRIPGLVIAPN